MSDDRWNSDDERAPYIDRGLRQGPHSNVRPCTNQPDRRGPPTADEIAAFVAKEFGDTERAERKRLLRPEGWDDFIGPIQQKQREPGED
jgi:hypothetical protein